MNFISQRHIQIYDQPTQVPNEDKTNLEDIPKVVGDYVYGPQGVRQLKNVVDYDFGWDVMQFIQPFPNGPVINADSLAWFANVMNKKEPIPVPGVKQG